MNETQTEQAQIVGGPLCGSNLTVVKWQETITVGKQKAKGAWAPGSKNPDTYYRSERKTDDGRCIYTPLLPVLQPA